MRQLKPTKPPTPAQQAEAAAALRWLEQQLVPEVLSEVEVAARFRQLMSFAQQYERQGLPLRELVEVGYRAGLAEPGRLWSGRVREGMAEANGRSIIGNNC
jgi:hypothetical protein